MAKAWALSLLLLFLALPIASLAERQRYRRQRSEQGCRRLEAQEPTRSLESEAGRSEFWDHNNEQFQYAGVSGARHTIHPRGLLLPSSSNSPRLVYVVEGQGIGGIVIPGCSESYYSSSSRVEEEEEEEEERSRRRRQIQSRRLGRYGEERSHREDQHQRIHHLRKGDIIAVPAGVAVWSYNNGDRPLIVVSVMDTANYINQLDNTPRRFFLGGTFSQQRGSRQRGSETRRQGEREEQSFGNIFDGFDTELIAEALGISRETASKLQGRRREQKGMIVRVEEGLQTIKPREYEEEEYEEERRGGRRGSREYQEERRGGRRGSREYEEEEEERRRERRGSSESQEEEQERRRRERRGSRESEEEEERRRGRRASREFEEEGERRRSNERERRGEREREEERRGEREREEERRGERERQEERRSERMRGSERSREQEEERRMRRRMNGFLNGVEEETVCSLKFKLNIGNPRHSDVYSMEAGRLTTLNSFKLPLLKYLQLGADVGLLQRNAIMGPKWNTNSHSVKYVIRGSARVQIVDSDGNSVMDQRVNQGQMFVVPQNFVEITRAEDEQYEWVSFHTTDYSISNHLAGKGSTLKGIPVDVLANSFDISREEARNLKQGRSRELAVFVPRSHQHSFKERRAVA